MTRMLCTAVLVSFFIGATALTSLAASEQTSHHPADAQSASSSPGMMMQGAGMNSMPCMVAPSSESGTQMMGMMGQGMGDMMGRGGMHGMMGGGGMHGMMNGGQMHKMEQDMRSMLYLDRAADLGLSAEQISRLKAGSIRPAPQIQFHSQSYLFFWSSTQGSRIKETPLVVENSGIEFKSNPRSSRFARRRGTLSGTDATPSLSGGSA